MSLLNKTPYLNTILNGLTKAELVSLRESINGSSSFVHRSLDDASCLLSADDKMKAVNLSLSATTDSVNGWFLGSSFIQYYPDRDIIQLYSIDLTKMRFKVINEPATATDLRQILDSLLIEKGEIISVQADDIDSGEEAVGKVLTADGEGGASWQTASGGSNEVLANTIVEYDEDEAITYFTLPKGILPLMFYEDGTGETYFFDFDNMRLLDETGDRASGCKLGSSSEYDDRIMFGLSGDYRSCLNPPEPLTKLIYINFDGAEVDDGSEFMLNTYNIIKGQPKKLYKHYIEGLGGDISFQWIDDESYTIDQNTTWDFVVQKWYNALQLSEFYDNNNGTIRNFTFWASVGSDHKVRIGGLDVSGSGQEAVGCVIISFDMTDSLSADFGTVDYYEDEI